MSTPQKGSAPTTRKLSTLDGCLGEGAEFAEAGKNDVAAVIPNPNTINSFFKCCVVIVLFKVVIYSYFIITSCKLFISETFLKS